MNRYILILLGLQLLFSASAGAQNDGWQYYYDLLAEEADEEDADMETVYEQLSDIASNPININAVTREELEQLYFLDSRQIDAVIEYVERYGPLRSKAEFMMMPYFDDARRGLLASLSVLGEMHQPAMDFIDSLKFKEGAEDYRRYLNTTVRKGELSAYMRLPLYSREGDREGYQGYKYKHWIRFNYRFNQHLKVGAVGSQDSGEPFFYGRNKWGYDYYSAYIQLQKLGFARNIVVGSYRMRTGLGLIVNNNISFGKTFGLASLHSPATPVRPHSSRSSGYYMQGAAATIDLTRQLQATAFASYRPIDATLDTDGKAIKTILRSGYHRTAAEMERKNNASQTSMGLNVSFNRQRLHLGATALWNHYDLPLKPYEKGSSMSQLYRRFYPTGRDFTNLSLDYGYRLGKRFALQGETATDSDGNIATINTLSWMPARRITLTAIQRYYPYRFCSTMGRSFSEGGSNNNESGIYLGAEWMPSPTVAINAYTDMAYFRWPRYQATGSSYSFDNLVQASIKVAPRSSLLLRYRIKMRQRDTDTEGMMAYRSEHRMRVALRTSRGRLSMKSQADISYTHFDGDSFGIMLSQSAVYAMKPCKIVCGANYFHTRDYDSRVYAYEMSTPYNMSFPSFYGHGCRAYALAEAYLWQRMSIIGKVGMTHYFDRDYIGTGRQRINAPTQTDIDIMLRWRM